MNEKSQKETTLMRKAKPKLALWKGDYLREKPCGRETRLMSEANLRLRRLKETRLMRKP